MLGGSAKWHLCLNNPAHNWTPMIPKIKKTKKHNNKTLPNIGKVSNNNMTKILIPLNEVINLKSFEFYIINFLNSLTWYSINSSQWSQHSHCSDR